MQMSEIEAPKTIMATATETAPMLVTGPCEASPEATASVVPTAQMPKRQSAIRVDPRAPSPAARAR